MRKSKKVLSFILVLLMVTTLAACGGNEVAEENDAGEKKEPISIGQINWAENIAVTNMWKLLLEDKGYTVELTDLDMGVIMQGLESGNLDMNLEVWLPVQDANYYKALKDKVNFSEASWFDNAKVGLVVPTYLEDVNSIEDLNANKDLFEGRIIGIDPGAGTMDVVEQLIVDYDLDYELIASSEPAMIAEIGDKIANDEAIVAPLWTPHWVFSKYDLKFLEDPQNIFGGVEKIHHATRIGFDEDYPVASQWFKNWKMTDAEIGQLIDYVENAEKPIDGAQKWIDENEELVNSWLK